MPANIVQTLNRAYTEALALPEVKDKLTQAGFTLRGSSAKELDTLSHSEYERIGKVAHNANMTSD